MSTKVFDHQDLELLLHKLESLMSKNKKPEATKLNKVQGQNIPLLTEVINPEQELQNLLKQTKEEIEAYITQSVKQQLEKIIERQLEKQFDNIKTSILNELKPQVDDVLPILIQKELNKIKLF